MSVAPLVALVGCLEHLQADEDAPLLRDAVAGLGLDARLVAWDDPSVNWTAFDLVVVRGTWDYIRRPETFLAWVEAVAGHAPLANPAAVIEWNHDKRYLADLAAAGLPTVPTTWAPAGQPVDAVAWPDAEVVVKPVVSGGGKDTARYARGERAQAVAHIVRLHDDGRTVMVQEYQPAVDREGELAMVYVGGTFSHAIRKGALLRPGAGVVDRLWEQEQLAAAEPTAAQRAAADATGAELVRRFGAAPTYSRVDLVTGPAGPLILEVELIDPDLFLRLVPGSGARLARAIAGLT